jgi:hypothetical protein
VPLAPSAANAISFPSGETATGQVLPRKTVRGWDQRRDPNLPRRPKPPPAGNCGEGDDPSIPLVSCPPPGETQLNPYSVAPWAISVAAGCKLVNPPRGLDGTTRCEDPQGRAPVLADFSSRGLPGQGELFEPDITAPGVFVISTCHTSARRGHRCRLP